MKTEPNKAVEPTPVNVTVRAVARTAPFTSAAHLARWAKAEMTITFPTGWFRSRTVTLRDREVEWTDRWLRMQRTDSVAYRALMARTVKPTKSTFAAIIISIVLSVPAIGSYAFAEYVDDPVFHVGTLLFALPVMIALREFIRTFRTDVLFVEDSEGGRRICFSYKSKHASVVEPCISELRRRIEVARKRGKKGSPTRRYRQPR